MKLNTRLALVVTLILTVATVISSAQSIIVHRNQKLETYNAVLENLSKQLKISSEDELSLALLISSQSPVPMSLVYVTEGDQISYLNEDADAIFMLPSKAQFLKGIQQPITMNDSLVSFYIIDKDEYLAYFVSLKELYSESSKTLRSVIFFNILLILFSAGLITFLFRRDSKLNSAAKRMQEFIGDASHELKTPLTVIRGYSELLTNTPHLVSKYSKRINEESLRMTRIIDQLLRIASLDENLSEAPASINISECLKTHIDDLLILEPKRKITFISNPLQIFAPYELVDTLISNIITNARIHSPNDTPIQVTITGKKVIIEDGGPGLKIIPDKPFQRFDSSRSRETGGSGLGMSLIQKSAKQLGAKIYFGKSVLGGLKVEITF